MKFLPVIRLVCWGICLLLVVLSFGVMGRSVIGGALMLSGAVWLCPASWRAIESLSGKRGSGTAVAILAVPLFLLGVHIVATQTGNSVTPPSLLRLLTDADPVIQPDARLPPEVNPGALNFFRHIMEQDYLSALAGGVSALNNLSMVNPVERLPSSKLARLFDDDEAAIDPLYKGRKLIVSGEILAVRVDFADDVVVELPGADELFNVQAKLDGDPQKFPGPVMEGSYVSLYCTLFGKVAEGSASHLYLTDCARVDFTTDARAYADNLTEALRGWLHTGGKHIFPSDAAATYFLVTYLSGTQLPRDNACLREEALPEECVSALEGIQAAALLEKARGDLRRWQDWLGLPSPAGHVQLSSR